MGSDGVRWGQVGSYGVMLGHVGSSGVIIGQLRIDALFTLKGKQRNYTQLVLWGSGGGQVSQMESCGVRLGFFG